MTPIPRTYCNWDAVHRVLETIPAMLGDGSYTTTAAMVLITVARHANQQEGLALASYETFFNEAGIPRSTVKYTIKKLVEAGFLQHVKDTYAYKLGPKVQTFLAESASDKPNGRKAAAPAPAPKQSNINKLLNYNPPPRS